MPNRKDTQNSGSPDPMSNKSDRESESQGQNASSGKSAQQAASSKKGPGSEIQKDDDDLKTSGGREGNFSDKNRDSERQWSPGSTQSSDQ
ncbi:MAG: hypothetical protein ABI646_10025 [Acidobacteriota bacterium]